MKTSRKHAISKIRRKKKHTKLERHTDTLLKKLSKSVVMKAMGDWLAEVNEWSAGSSDINRRRYQMSCLPLYFLITKQNVYHISKSIYIFVIYIFWFLVTKCPFWSVIFPLKVPFHPSLLIYSYTRFLIQLRIL